MRYLSLFSGIEAATQAWQPLGWECVGVSEIESFPCAVLAHHYPDMPNLGDVTKITEQQIKDLGQIDLVVFGSPCQNLSVAGNRKGFDGEQSSLFYDSIRIIQYARKHCGARFALWENVPGAFSSNKGADFAAVVEQMAGLSDVDVPTNGWGKEGAAVGDNGLLEWSVLDAQWFGLAQRRKRVFAIVDFGNWTSRPPILLERESLRGNSAPSRETGQDFTADIRASTASESFYLFVEPSRARALDVLTNKDPVLTLQANMGTGGNNMPLLCQENVYAISGNMIGRQPHNGPNGASYDNSGSCYTLTATDRHAVAYGFESGITQREGNPKRFNSEICPTLRANMSDNQVGVAYGFKAGQGAKAGGIGCQSELSPTLTSANSGSNMVPSLLIPPSVVRRLTPIECEKLQGFPDDFTKIPYRNKPAHDCPNGVRYKALGNSMAVNVMAWIGRSIESSLLYERYEPLSNKVRV